MLIIIGNFHTMIISNIQKYQRRMKNKMIQELNNNYSNGIIFDDCYHFDFLI